jgi:hypothetical protein
LELAEHRILLPEFDERITVVVDREHPRDLPGDRIEVIGTRAGDRELQFVAILDDCDSDLVFVPSIETEGEPHDTVEVALTSVAETEERQFAQRERTAGGNARDHALIVA